MGNIRVLHSSKYGIDILTFYENGLSFGSMGIACFAGIEAAERSLSDVRHILPAKEELWWNVVGIEIRGGGVRIFFQDHYQEKVSVRPDVLRIVNLVWGSAVLLPPRASEEERRWRTEHIRKWCGEYYSETRQC